MKVPAAVALCLLLGRPAQALDPTRAPSQYVIGRWGTASLGSNTVHALLQSRDGALWIGTGAGLLRYDGTRFVAYGAARARELGGGVSSLAEAADGSLYVGTSTGVVLRHDGTAFTPLPLRDPTGPVRSLRVTRDGTLWIGQYGRPVARWRAGAPAQYYLEEVQTVSAVTLAEDAAGVLWVGSGEGLLRFDGATFPRDAATADIVQSLLPRPGGDLWVGTRHGLLRVAGGRVSHFTTRHGLPHDSIFALAADGDGNLWVGTAGGLGRYRDGVFASLTTREGLPDDDVHALLVDRDGNVWVGTGDGLACLSDGRFVTWGRLEGMPDPVITSVAAARGGGAWLGTDSAQVVRLAADGRRQTFALPAGRGPEAATSLYEATDGALWIVMANGKVFRLSGGRVRDLTPALDRRMRQRVSGFFEDGDGIGVLVMRMGPARLRDGTAVPVYADAHDFGWPHVVHRDAGGTLWIASSAGLARVHGGALVRYGLAEGLPHLRVRAISEDADGSLWLATGGGLARLQDGRAQHLGVAQGLPDDYLRVVLDDGLGHLWLAGLGSLCRVDKRDVLDVFAGKATRVSPILFDTSDGLRTTEARITNSPAFRAADGKLWFATTKGVSVVDPRRVSTDRPAPRVTIESLLVDRRPGDTRAAGAYGPGKGEVAVEYGAVGFVAPHKVRFRYRLDGLDEDWVEAGDRRQAYYGALPAGTYRFQVMASNPDGRWNGTATTLAFTLRPPFVRTPLFYLICIAAAGLVAAVAYRLRVGRIRARFDGILAERTRIAREMHDTLAQGVAGVGLQIETVLRMLDKEPNAAREHLRRAHAMARSSLDEIRRSIWVLRAQTSAQGASLGQTLSSSLEALAADGGVAATVHVTGTPRSLDVAVERNLLRIAHEAATNALRHSGAARITVSLEYAPDGVVLSVRDDGRGFDVEKHLASSGREHFGLIGILERVRVLGGNAAVQSRAGAGTEIVCRIPYTARADAAESMAEMES